MNVPTCPFSHGRSYTPLTHNYIYTWKKHARLPSHAQYITNYSVCRVPPITNNHEIPLIRFSLQTNKPALVKTKPSLLLVIILGSKIVSKRRGWVLLASSRIEFFVGRWTRGWCVLVAYHQYNLCWKLDDDCASFMGSRHLITNKNCHYTPQNNLFL